MKSDDESLEYTLRVAYLQSLIEQRAIQPRPSSIATQTPDRPSSIATSSRRSYDGPSSFFFDFSSLMGGRESGKSPKYPEKMLKIMDSTLQRIAMGQEARYSDQRFRRTAALFWSSTWADKTFQKQQRESRKVEDLILPFVTTATKALKKDDELAEGAWKYELNTQISLFLNLISDSIYAVGPIPPELANRLESYKARLKAPAPTTPAVEKNGLIAGNGVDRGDVESVKSSRSREADPKGGVTGAVGALFELGDENLQQRVRGLQGLCTEQAALEDLKTCLQRLNTESPFPLGPLDFADSAQWNAFRSQEVSTLSQMMLLMMQANPTLTQSSDKPDLSSRMDSISLNSSTNTPIQAFTYIPPNPRETYRILLERMLEYDLEAMATLPEDQEVSLGILTADHLALLGECALRWRLSQMFRSWCFLSCMQERFEGGQVPLDCVTEALGMGRKVQTEIGVENWPLPDQSGLESTCLKIFTHFLSNIEVSLSQKAGYNSPDFNESFQSFISITSDLPVPSPDPLKHPNPTVVRIEKAIVEKIRVQAFKSYINESGERMEFEGGKNRGFAMAMAGWIESGAKKLNKKFGDAITEKVDLVPLVVQQHLNLWMRDLEDAMTAPSLALGPEGEIEEAFALYRRAQKLIDLGNAFSSEPMRFALEPIFEGVVHRWLDQTAAKTKQWADAALAEDNFTPVTPNGPSSSVTDLFDSFRSASNFIMELGWADERQLASFATRLARIFSLSIDDYCNKMEQLFLSDMRQTESVQSSAKQKAWIEKAKSTISSLQGEKKIQAFFNFTAASCVKLNNIEAARQQLDRLYQDMRVDDLAAYETPEPTLPSDQKYLFTIKIVLAEGLTLDSTSSNSNSNSKLPDSFVILSDEHGNRYAKTRTIYDDPDPRWDETFDIATRGSAWFMATVRHRTLGGKHDLLGRAYIRLDPGQYMDLISKDLLLPLDTRGHLLLRVSMEGERDDIQFHFGRAFRWLKRTESDMIRVFVDKMTPVLRHTLSRASIKSVLKPGGNSTLSNLDYNEALGKLATAYRSALATAGASPADYSIPPPPPEKKVIRGPTDSEIESAIHPLFDYLDTNNHTLATTLSHEAMQMVMAKLWKQILTTIESLIVPPLSDKPSLMRALSDGELDIALRWLKFLRDFFYVGGDESGVPISVLQNQKFNEILSVRIYYDWKTDDLMEECIRGFQSTLQYKQTKPSKSLLFQRNLGTIRARKSAKKAMPTGGNNTEMIMRILRMRSGTQEFLAQQIATISAVKLENPNAGRKTRSLMSSNRFGR